MEHSQKFDDPLLRLNGEASPVDERADRPVSGDGVSEWAGERLLPVLPDRLRPGGLVAGLWRWLRSKVSRRRLQDGTRESALEAYQRMEAERWRSLAIRLESELESERMRVKRMVIDSELERRKLQAESQAARYEVQLLADVHERDRKRVESEVSAFARQIAENVSRQRQE